MGMFDYLRCKYPLPVKGVNDMLFQTKDSPAQQMDEYEIREDGTLWHQDYDIEDRSDPNAEGIARIFGMMTRINERWEPEPMTGEILFYDGGTDWELGFSAYFVDGKLRELHTIRDTTPIVELSCADRRRP